MQESVLSKVTGQSNVMLDIGSRLSLIWIFFAFNAAYGDIGTLYYSVFINPTPLVHYTQVFLLGGAALVEISMVMVVLSRILKPRINRLANIVTGVFLTAVQSISLFVATPTLGYSFISAMMIAAGVAIVWSAWKWPGRSDSRAPSTSS